jgi:transposase
MTRTRCARLPQACRPSWRARTLRRDAEIHAKTLHIEKLRMQLSVLRRARFGRSSEKLDRDIEQLELLIGELEEEAAESDARAAGSTQPDPVVRPAPARERRQPVRRPLPSHLPRETVVHEPACTCPGCGSTVFSCTNRHSICRTVSDEIAI